MKLRVGLGIANFPFSDARAFWRWVERCEDSTVDSIWQTDRLVSPVPQLESMTTMAALAGATRRLKFGMNVTVGALDRRAQRGRDPAHGAPRDGLARRRRVARAGRARDRRDRARVGRRGATDRRRPLRRRVRV